MRKNEISLEQLKKYAKKLAEEQVKQTVNGYKNNGLYILCCSLAFIKLAEGTNCGEKEWTHFYTIGIVADHYYDEIIEGKLELL